MLYLLESYLAVFNKEFFIFIFIISLIELLKTSYFTHNFGTSICSSVLKLFSISYYYFLSFFNSFITSVCLVLKVLNLGLN